MELKSVIGMLLAAALTIQAAPPPKKTSQTNPDADFKKAVGLYTQGKTAEAKVLFTKVQKAKPTRPDVYYYLGLCDAKASNYDAAIANLGKAIGLNGEYAAAFFERGNAYVCQETFQEAANDFDRVTQLDPGNTQAWNNRGMAYHKLKNYDEVIKSFAPVLQQDPKNGYAHYYTGLSYYYKRQQAYAMEQFQIFLQLMPDAPEAPWVRKFLQEMSSW